MEVEFGPFLLLWSHRGTHNAVCGVFAWPDMENNTPLESVILLKQLKC